MPKFGDFLGIVKNSFQIGNRQSGFQSLLFHNGFLSSLRANPTASRTWTLPDRDGTLATTDQITSGSSSGVSMSARQYVRIYNDFLLGLGDFISMTSSGAANSQIAENVDFGGHPGQAVLATGTSSTGYGCLGMGNSVSTIQFGYGEWELEACLQLPILATSTDNYVAQFGFSNVTNNFTTRGANCVSFRYTSGENSQKWQAVVSINNTVTTFDTGVTVTAGTWYTLRAYINATANSVRFTINGTVVVPDTAISQFPVGRQLNVFCGMAKSAGTTKRELYVDYIEGVCKMTVLR